MQINLVNNVSNQNFGKLNFSPEAGAFIKKEAMNPRGSQEWSPLVNTLKQAKAKLQDQKWGDVFVTLKDSNEDGIKKLAFFTALFTPALLGRSIQYFAVGKTEYDAEDNCIKNQEYGKMITKKEELPTEEWASIDVAVNIAELHEQRAEAEEKKVNAQKQLDDQYCEDMSSSLKELGLE